MSAKLTGEQMRLEMILTLAKKPLSKDEESAATVVSSLLNTKRGTRLTKKKPVADYIANPAVTSSKCAAVLDAMFTKTVAVMIIGHCCALSSW